MPIKAFYSIEPGEAIVADEIKRRYPGLHIFFPEKDSGIDLVVMGDLSKSARYPLTIQVKESRYYNNGSLKGHSWHDVQRRKLVEFAEAVDFYVFVTYVDLPEGNKVHFSKEFIVAPTPELVKNCQKKASKDIYRFYFSFRYDEGSKVLDVKDTREHRNWGEAPSYLAYYNNWEQLVDTLEDQEDIRSGLLGLNEAGAISWEEYKEWRRVQGE